MNWSNLFSKAKHALVVGVGAGVAVVVGALTGGAAIPIALAGKVALGAAITYMIKPARPEPTLDASAVK
jgi:hypothetical protein